MIVRLIIGAGLAATLFKLFGAAGFRDLAWWLVTAPIWGPVVVIASWLVILWIWLVARSFGEPVAEVDYARSW